MTKQERVERVMQFVAARAMLAALEAAIQYIKPACEDGYHAARLLRDQMEVAIAAAKAAGIK